VKSEAIKPKEVSSYFLKEVSRATAHGGDERLNDPEAAESKKIGGKLSKIEREAYEKGFSAGEEAGRALGLRKLDPTEKILLKLIEEINRFKANILTEAEEDILTIALAISRRIIGQEIKENPEIILKNIQKAIEKIGETEKLVIRLHPEDLEILARDADEVIYPENKNIALRFEASAVLAPGDYIVEGEERMIDGRQKNQFKILEALLRTQIQ